jgi:hypothetical protein
MTPAPHPAGDADSDPSVPEVLRLWDGPPAAKEALVAHYRGARLQAGDIVLSHLLLLAQMSESLALQVGLCGGRWRCRCRCGAVHVRVCSCCLASGLASSKSMGALAGNCGSTFLPEPECLHS